jgi:hypothetical protein
MQRRRLRAPSSRPSAVTGANISLIPRECARILELPGEQADYGLISFDGTRIEAQAVVADLTFPNKTFRGRFVPTNEQEGILGRDILNFFWILLDGPNLSWDAR